MYYSTILYNSSAKVNYYSAVDPHAWKNLFDFGYPTWCSAMIVNQARALCASINVRIAVVVQRLDLSHARGLHILRKVDHIPYTVQ